MIDRERAFHLEVRATLRDTDALGHVNNACYLTWMEEVRNRYVYESRQIEGIEAFDFILARTEIDYRSAVLFHETVDLYCVPVAVGTKSWTHAYEGRVREDGRLAFEARAILVHFDFKKTQRACEIPKDFRTILESDRMEA